MAFKQSLTLKGTWKNVYFQEDDLIDSESGEILDLIAIFKEKYGDKEFSITSNYKEDTELE